MNLNALKRFWLAEERHSFQGWDFSYLDNRWFSESTDWDYETILKSRLRSTDKLLDMGTGGGEFLLSLNHPYHQTSVTEAYPPNIQLCREQIVPLGIRFYPVDNHENLPIKDNQFDIIINRHAEYDLHEVQRILKPNGLFITQQIAGDNCLDFAKKINPNNPPAKTAFDLSTELPLFKKLGFRIEYANESYPELYFFDVGTVVFWAKIIQWTFPDFSVERNFSELCRLQSELSQKNFVSAKQHLFIVSARNTK